MDFVLKIDLKTSKVVITDLHLKNNAFELSFESSFTIPLKI